MIPLPNPLHPAIVHFPIVLILFGTVGAVASVFLRRWHLPWLAAGLLALGVIGAFAATWSGETAAEVVGELSPAVEELLEQHEDWGERTRTVALVAAFLMILSASIGRFPRVARTVAVVGAIVAIASAFCVIETGHYGGQLVYRHGVGINLAVDSGSTVAPSPKEKEDE